MLGLNYSILCRFLDKDLEVRLCSKKIAKVERAPVKSTVSRYFCRAAYCSVHTPINNEHRHALFDQKTALKNIKIPYANFHRATACNATHGISKAFLSVCLSVSVGLSVKRVDCDKTKENCAHILYHTSKVIHPSFLTEEWLVGTTPSA